MSHIEVGYTALGILVALLLFLAFALEKGRKYYEEEKAQKKADFKKSFLKVKPLK
ncbi:MAG: hypothetical protein WC667_13015 [Sulfurimonas sp.]|jgi:hypothetical protein